MHERTDKGGIILTPVLRAAFCGIPIWELSVGEYRVFYDVDEAAMVVNIRAIRHKPPHKTTEEIL